MTCTVEQLMKLYGKCVIQDVWLCVCLMTSCALLLEIYQVDGGIHIAMLFVAKPR